MVLKNKKILFVVSSLRRGGGAENSVSIVVRELKDRGHNVELLTFYRFENEYDIGKVKHNSLGFKYKSNPITKMIYFSIIFPLLIKRFLKQNKYDLIIANAEDANLILSLTRLYSTKKFKLWLVVRNNYLSLYKGIYSKISIALHKKSDKVIAVSEAMEKDLKNLNIHNLDFIYNPLDFDEIKEKLREKITNESEIKLFKENKVIYLNARLSKQKNYFFILDIFKELIKNNEKLKLVIFGAGPEEQKIKNYVKQLEIKEDVVFMGIRNNVFKYLTKSHLAVLPSNHEGFPRVLLENIACGIPTIANDCKYGPCEILNETSYLKFKDNKFEKAKYGLLVPFNNKKEYVNAIQYLLDNKKEYNKYKEKSKERAKDFDIKNIIRKWERRI
ncbi:MAG: glycosyltransferase [Candidatus Woesearchaeota archaeon]|jgi:N-acetylgalactosamine-N,N'-diacetylbacillosaminyl-diphospho-undecaprenol 4-alpha-N-acetylgalactosaminyltransferase|nr:glycosyltransferase [Candidatus Woesearchaeota archaeon]